ncbi:hypothetical protein NQ318_006486 [Aromia moschata]|uniref:Uncharacterized protein n=1 Tax=Aromia moschata TaxID=1265417 RepID=A0AAV8YPJ9_9CUCU|nr:hypothetical protein NQ318_006486 [Aromia moschata]
MSWGASLSEEVTVDSPNVAMKITDRNGEDIMQSAEVGDPLALRFEILDKNSPYEIFVRELVAMDGVDSSEIVLIDSDGCPTDHFIMGPIYNSRSIQITDKFGFDKQQNATASMGSEAVFAPGEGLCVNVAGLIVAAAVFLSAQLAIIAAWTFALLLHDKGGLSKNKKVSSFCEELYKSGNRSPFLLAVLVDMCYEQVNEGGGDSVYNLERARALCNDLMTTYDTIRAKYWLHMLETIEKKAKEGTDEAGSSAN